jgi:glycosyltransferase involved in cell wall biosynthesis
MDMRIAQILPELHEGGVERGVIETNREFTLLGNDSHVISAGGRLVEQLVHDGGHHHELDVCSKNILATPLRSSKLSKLVDLVNPDIIHARSRVPAWLAHFANKKRKRPFVTTVHGLNSVNRYSKIMTSGDRVICVSEVVRDYIIKNYSTDPNILRVIQRGVDMDQFNPHQVDNVRVSQLRDKFNLHGKLVITSVGRITWLKDYETFIKSMAKLCQHTPEAVGLITGGYRKDKSDYFKSLQQLVADYKLEGRIIFTGSQEDIASIYNLSDIVVNASLKMGNMGRTVVEALAVGKPVIATSFEGLRNLVEDDKNGYVINNKDVDGLADALIRILRTSFTAEAIRSTVPEEYTLDHMVESILNVYRELL